jgi:hypothetical protein
MPTIELSGTSWTSCDAAVGRPTDCSWRGERKPSDADRAPPDTTGSERKRRRGVARGSPARGLVSRILASTSPYADASVWAKAATRGVRTARGLVRDGRLGLLGAVAYWGFDIAVLGVCFDAFGRVVPVAVLVMGYFLAREPASTPRWRWRGRGRNDRRVRRLTREQRRSRAVLAYRAISFWLPALPGIAGYLALRSTVRGWRAADGSRCVERGHRLRGMRKTSS